MEHAVMVVPVGSFTPLVSRRVCDAAIANANEHPVIISMQNADHYSWSALGILAAFLRKAHPAFAIHVAYPNPRTRSLLSVAGIKDAWPLRESTFAERRIFIA